MALQFKSSEDNTQGAQSAVVQQEEQKLNIQVEKAQNFSIVDTSKQLSRSLSTTRRLACKYDYHDTNLQNSAMMLQWNFKPRSGS